MIGILATLSLILLLGLLSEYLFKKKYIGSGVSRKLVHMGTGVVVAFTPYFLGWDEIKLLSIILVVGVILSSNLNLFKSIHSVKRTTKGELLFAIGVVVCAFLQPAEWIFTAAVLHLAIADAAAAVVGVKWGKRTSYSILSHGKSMIGSLTFFYVSLGIMFCAFLFVDSSSFPPVFVSLIIVPAYSHVYRKCIMVWAR